MLSEKRRDNILKIILRGIKSSLSSSERKSVKSKSHSVNGLVIFFTNSSQCSSFSDFFGSGFLISWSLLGDLIIQRPKTID